MRQGRLPPGGDLRLPPQMTALPQQRRLSITIRKVLPALAGLNTLTRLSLGKLAW